MGKREQKIGKFNSSMLFGLALFVLALGFRLVGIGWGLKNDLHNASYHPDETVVFGFSRSIQPELGQFVPANPPQSFYSYGTFYLSLLKVASDMTSAYTGGPKVRGDGFSWSNPELTDWDWVSRCHLAGRIISALAGAATVLVVFLILRKSVGLLAACAGGLLLTVAPGHLIQSRFQTVDILATFFIGATLFYAVSISLLGQTPESPETLTKDPTLKLAILGGVMAGLSAGSKYTGILALLSVITALLLKDRRTALIPCLASIGAATAVFLVSTPGVLFDWSHFIGDFQFEMIHTSTGHGLVFTGTPNGFVYTLTNLMFGVGPLLTLLGIGGLGYASYRRHKWAFVLLAFSVPYFLLIGRAEVKFLRYSFPLYVGLAVGFGYLVEASHRKGGAARVGVGLAILGLGGVPFGGLSTAILESKAMLDEDPRDQAARYLLSQSGTVGFPNTPWFWSAPLFPDSADPLRVPLSVKMLKAGPRVALIPDEHGFYATSWGANLITKLSPNFLTYSSFESFPIDRLQGRKDLGPQQGEVDNAVNFLHLLEGKYNKDRYFGNPIMGGNYPDMLPEDLLYTNPVVYVWKKK